MQRRVSPRALGIVLGMLTVWAAVGVMTYLLLVMHCTASPMSMMGVLR